MLSAHRTGQLQKVAETLASEVERRADDLRRLTAKQRALQSLLEMKRSGELQCLASEMEDGRSVDMSRFHMLIYVIYIV